jgi:transcriptional regulator with XRE-family HTH domain
MTAEKTALNERQSEIKAKLMKEFVQLRKSKKMTQQALADKTGIARPNIARMENGTYNPTVDMMVRMADGLGMTIEINWIEK